MHIEIRCTPATEILALQHLRDEARTNYFAHIDPGGLTPAQKQAWAYEHFALQLILQAAQLRLDAEAEMQLLLRNACAA